MSGLTSTSVGRLAAGGAGSTRKRQQRNRSLIGLLLALPAIILILVIFVVPLCVSAWMSLNSWPLLGDHKFIGLRNYMNLFKDPSIGQSLSFTVGFAAIVTPVTFLIGLGLATLVQHRRRGVGVIRTAIFAPVAIGLSAASYLWLALTDPGTGVFDRFLVDTHASPQPLNWLLYPSLALVLVLIVTIWKSAGFAMIALLNGLQSIPTEIEDAARVDGAGPIRMMLQVRLPLMRNSIAFALTFLAVGALLSFDQFYILTSGGPSNSTITAVYRIFDIAFVQGDLGYAAAFSLVFLFIVLVITSSQLWFFRRRDDN